MNLCPYCYEPVAKQGYTCDLKCYNAWTLTWEGFEEHSGLIILPDNEEVPLTLHLQPWYLAEYKDEVKPTFKDGIVLKPQPSEVRWVQDK